MSVSLETTVPSASLEGDRDLDVGSRAPRRCSRGCRRTTPGSSPSNWAAKLVTPVRSPRCLHGARGPVAVAAGVAAHRVVGGGVVGARLGRGRPGERRSTFRCGSASVSSSSPPPPATTRPTPSRAATATTTSATNSGVRFCPPPGGGPPGVAAVRRRAAHRRPGRAPAGAPARRGHRRGRSPGRTAPRPAGPCHRAVRRWRLRPALVLARHRGARRRVPLVVGGLPPTGSLGYVAHLPFLDRPPSTPASQAWAPPPPPADGRNPRG